MKLSLYDIAEKRRILERLHAATDALNEGIQDYNQQAYELHAKLEQLVKEYDMSIEAANTFATAVLKIGEDYVAERSDAWLDSPRGQASMAFVNAWGEFGLSDYAGDACEFEEIEEVDTTASDRFEALPVAPQGEIP